jgi:hypothetical protein
MDESKPGPPHTQIHREHGHEHAQSHHPYWRRAHRDWKLWVVVLLMLGAMAVYLTSNDLSVQPHAPATQPVP